MKLTSKTAGIGVVTAAALLLAGAGIADTAGQMGGPMGMMGPMPDLSQVDADKDGKVSKDEIKAFQAARLAEVDADKDGKLSAEELAQMHIKAMTERAKDMAARMVTRLDSDGDGLLSATELVSRPVPDKLFDRIDANQDGFIDQAEADAAREQMREHRGNRGGKGWGGHGWNHDKSGPQGWMDEDEG